MEIRSLDAHDRAWADALVSGHFGSTRIVSRGRLHDAALLPGLVAIRDSERAGLLLFRPEGDQCELIALVSACPRKGVATALVRSLCDRLRDLGCARAWLVTTNDNVAAQSLYRSLGWSLVAVHRGAVTHARALKPEIPLIGEGGIPIEDELEYGWSARA
ncbi:MAG TPA: GNAT family N-acetyltransferase [Coriobacteriia bacterium]|nr:GNAT family N-acetyltransferase [Coriobacteriia bacterium]